MVPITWEMASHILSNERIMVSQFLSDEATNVSQFSSGESIVACSSHHMRESMSHRSMNEMSESMPHSPHQMTDGLKFPLRWGNHAHTVPMRLNVPCARKSKQKTLAIKTYNRSIPKMPAFPTFWTNFRLTYNVVFFSSWIIKDQCRRSNSEVGKGHQKSLLRDLKIVITTLIVAITSCFKGVMTRLFKTVVNTR